MVKYLLFRYLRFDKSQPFIALCSLLAFLGVSIGLMVLIIAMGIMNGFDKEFERKLFAMNYPITIIPAFRGGINDELVKNLSTKFPDLKFSPYLSTQTVLKNGDSLEGGLIFGVNFDKERQINSVLNTALNKLQKSPQNFEIIIGKGLFDEFGLRQNDKITAIFMHSNPTGFGISPQLKRFDVSGYFHSGLIAYDKGYSYTSLSALRKLLGLNQGQYHGIHVFSNNPKKDINALKSALPVGFGAIGWWEQNGNFFSALELEKRALFIVLMLIILVASLNIISSLLMTVMNRRAEIALLLALGASKNEIKNSFFAQGLVIGGSGIICGLILGLIGIWLLGNFEIISLPADVYGSSKLPMELSFSDLMLTLFGSCVIVAASSFYPAKKAANVDVLNTLRNE